MKRLHSAIHDFGKAGVVGHVQHRDAVVGKVSLGAPGRHNFKLQLHQSFDERHKSCFIADTDQRPARIARHEVTSSKFNESLQEPPRHALARRISCEMLTPARGCRQIAGPAQIPSQRVGLHNGTATIKIHSLKTRVDPIGQIARIPSLHSDFPARQPKFRHARSIRRPVLACCDSTIFPFSILNSTLEQTPKG